MLGFSIAALVSLLVFAVVLYLVFVLIQWAVGQFGLPAIIVKVAGIVLGLLFLLRVLTTFGVK